MDVTRVLLVTSNFGGGTGAHVAGIIGQLDPSRWEIEVLAFGSVDVQLPGHVRVCEVVPSGRLDRFPLTQCRQLRMLRHRVLATQPDVVHTYFIWPILYGRILKRLGVIRQLVENREDEGFNLAPWQRRVMKLTSNLPDRVICVSSAVRSVVLEGEGLAADRTLVIRNGIRLPNRRPDPETVQELRRELGFSPDHLIVGMVANLNRSVKGGRYFIESLPAILNEVPEARFLVIGGGKDKTSGELRAQKLGIQGKVVFTGFREDIARFYPLMDVSVLTSLSEGLSITLLESMSHGLPVVATRVGGNPELVRDGETGLLVPARDPESFAAAVIRVLQSPKLRLTMGRAGRDLVVRDFRLSSVARRYGKVYADVVDGSAPEGLSPTLQGGA